MTVWLAELCVCVSVSLIQQTTLDHLLRERRCTRAGNTTENRAIWRAEPSLQVPSTQASLGREARARALIMHGSQRAVLTFEGLVSRPGPSNPQQGPPTLQSLSHSFPPCPHHRASTSGNKRQSNRSFHEEMQPGIKKPKENPQSQSK